MRNLCVCGASRGTGAHVVSLAPKAGFERRARGLSVREGGSRPYNWSAFSYFQHTDSELLAELNGKSSIHRKLMLPFIQYIARDKRECDGLGLRISRHHRAVKAAPIEGLTAKGKKTRITIRANTVGNDSPIEITHGTWYRPELNLLLRSTQNDPRFGLSNENRHRRAESEAVSSSGRIHGRTCPRPIPGAAMIYRGLPAGIRRSE